ncbi:hypothetical protein GCM10010298_35070 [Streptomyces microflavus]|uniref:Uncharacterized protein n=2 Tax=Streptomyces TaxID=1883 RepID=A0A7J0D652_STRMI|nr:hypothetical protein Smic_80930 [Streptomyces microflavus]GGX67313.1 hypothetical protein GCM10010298_35070 [Streptomyces microflavus]
MGYTLADAIRAGFERDHPNGKNTLLCVGLCRRRKDREEFRKLPTHGRAAACLDCEGYGIGIGGNRLWDRTYADRMAWNLEQAREKLRMYQRYAAKLRAERYDGHWVKALAVSGVVAQMAEAREKHLWRAVEARRQKWAPLITEALSKAHTLKEEEAWQTPTT